MAHGARLLPCPHQQIDPLRDALALDGVERVTAEHRVNPQCAHLASPFGCWGEGVCVSASGRGFEVVATVEPCRRRYAERDVAGPRIERGSASLVEVDGSRVGVRLFARPEATFGAMLAVRGSPLHLVVRFAVALGREPRDRCHLRPPLPYSAPDEPWNSASGNPHPALRFRPRRASSR